ncbi:substrate-binding periplasmic protein [Pseudodesulfovibrio indicus]|uniref:Polar amino acid transport system substrate-binding protein n=1 Tax=Pseudodesulfovibrio indicus TaxID=1716143 RepID=A0A126QNQ2_9BACT|nr:ABC transporter substrate-binding protein [Pseudodesulfovibrio indicus]AMK11459.1 hypothetical protein AWY79_10190 [Pseudodesulfovibrio indicus]TDT89854.1 polar amino acid transport system substrate-binding protein [Pseudodesulfovibrio indicus]
MKCIFTSLILTAFLVFGALPAWGENFIALAPPYPPYCVSSGLTVKGMAVSTLTTIMNMCGIPLDEDRIKLMSWTYAFENTVRGPERIMLNAQRTPDSEQLFKWVGPVVTSKIVLIGRKRDKLFIPTREQLNGYRIATVRWSRPEKSLLAGGVDKDKLERHPSHVQALRSLDKGEVDLFAFTQLGAPCLMEGLGMSKDDYEICFTFDEEPLYFAFSKDTDDNLIARLNRALKDMKASGPSGKSQFDMMFEGQLD